MSDRDRSDDSWREEDAGKDRAEVLLYRTEIGPPGSGSPWLDELMAFAQPKGWRWISLNLARAADTKVAPGTEDLAAALDRLLAVAKTARDELSDYEVFEDGDEVPSMIPLEDALRAADRAYDALVTRLDEDREPPERQVDDPGPDLRAEQHDAWLQKHS